MPSLKDYQAGTRASARVVARNSVSEASPSPVDTAVSQSSPGAQLPTMPKGETGSKKPAAAARSRKDSKTGKRSLDSAEEDVPDVKRPRLDSASSASGNALPLGVEDSESITAAPRKDLEGAEVEMGSGGSSPLSSVPPSPRFEAASLSWKVEDRVQLDNERSTTSPAGVHVGDALQIQAASETCSPHEPLDIDLPEADAETTAPLEAALISQIQGRGKDADAEMPSEDEDAASPQAPVLDTDIQQIPSLDYASQFSTALATPPSTIKRRRKTAVTATPHPPVDKISQLLTPAESVDAEVAIPASAQRPKRGGKKRDFYGDLVPTGSVEATAEEDAAVPQGLDDEEHAEEIGLQSLADRHSTKASKAPAAPAVKVPGPRSSNLGACPTARAAREKAHAAPRIQKQSTADEAGQDGAEPTRVEQPPTKPKGARAKKPQTVEPSGPAKAISPPKTKRAIAKNSELAESDETVSQTQSTTKRKRSGKAANAESAVPEKKDSRSKAKRPRLQPKKTIAAETNVPISKPARKSNPKSKANKTKSTAEVEVQETSNAAEKFPKGKPRRASQIVVLSFPIPDPQRLALSQKLTAREPLNSKPLPQGQPEVWADSRQALCETVPYFKKPQGGCYQNDGHAYGMLYDAGAHCREYNHPDLIISRAGGGMEADSEGRMVQKKHQTLTEAQVVAVQNDFMHKNPMVVICGKRNEKAKCKMPHLYCVLDWFKPTLVWSEKTAGKGKMQWTTVKYRLERLNAHISAWHASVGEEGVTEEERDIAGELVEKTCTHCNHTWPQIYLRAWMCLNQNCEHFWTINGIDAPTGTEGLEYNPAFLLARSERWSSSPDGEEPEPSSLRPALPDFGNVIGDNLSQINTRGICCPKCGRCNPRRLFSGWICENPACDFQLKADHKPIMPTMLHTPWDAAPTLTRNRCAPEVKLSVEHKVGYKVSTYTFEGIGVQGRFIHAAATKEVVQEAGGVNDMFAEMQTADLGLERRTFAVKKHSGGGGKEKSALEGEAVLDTTETTLLEAEDDTLPTASSGKPDFADGDLMTAFSMNYGMPYKFVASGTSKPFSEAPETVREARRRLNWASRVFLDEAGHEDLNELLIFAYMQGQKIEYHDDGEEGLGPRIATLSLGGRAKMHLRMKMRHHVGCSKSGLLNEEEPLPTTLAFEERHKAWEGLRDPALDNAARNKMRKELPKQLGIFDKRNKKAEDLVAVTLNHGDIILMDGVEVQKVLEHKVVPEDHLRFALTCRTVKEGHLKAEERPGYEVGEDELVYEGPGFLGGSAAGGF